MNFLRYQTGLSHGEGDWVLQLEVINAKRNSSDYSCEYILLFPKELQEKPVLLRKGGKQGRYEKVLRGLYSCVNTYTETHLHEVINMDLLVV